MNKKEIIKFFRNFLPYRMRRQARELFVSNMIINLALAMVQIFEPIYLYRMGYSVSNIAIFYFFVYILYFFIMPYGAKFANRYGYENGMFIGSCLYIFFYLSLFLIPSFPILFCVAMLIYAIQKSFYWPAFHADFAHNSTNTEEGREISSYSISSSLMFVLGPIIGGLIITYFGFSVLFIIVSLLFLISNLPMLITKEEFTKRDFKYSFILKDIFKKKNFKSLFSYIGYAEELIAMVFWPIFMSVIIISYEKIGILSGISTMIMLIATLYIGKICDKRDKKIILRLSSFFYAFTWIAKTFTRTIIPIFIFDTASKTAKSGIDVSMRSIIYESAREGYKGTKDENDNSIMEAVVSFEAGLSIGKILACLFLFAFSIIFVSFKDFFTASFVFAGILSLFYMFK